MVNAFFSLPTNAHIETIGSCVARVLLYACCVTLTVFASAKTYEIGPSTAGSDCVEEFEQIANRLKPGDRLVLRGGRYEQSCRRAVSVQGTKENPIVIEAAVGERPVFTRPGHNRDTENNLELIDVRFLTIRGVEFTGGSIGVRLLGSTRHFELAHSVIRDTGNNAFAANVGDSSNLYLHHNTIHATGLSDGATEGEGFYLGCHDQSCFVTNSRIEYNTLFDLRGSGGGGNDGIEIKPGSGGNAVRHNSVTGSGSKTDFPCVLVYGGGVKNLVENNLLKNCSVGIYAVSDALVRGNVVVDSTVAGMVVRSHETIGSPSDVVLVNNTVVNRQSDGAGLRLSLWRARDVAVLNNAVLARRGPAIKGTWIQNADFSSNWVSGRLRGVPLRNTGIEVAGPADLIAPLLEGQRFFLAQFADAGTPSETASGSIDRAGTRRPQGMAIDIGAYEQATKR